MRRFADLARAAGDDLLSGLLFSLNEDCRWHRDWSAALVRLVIDGRPENRSVLQGWLAKWDPVVASALEGMAPLFDEAPVALKFAEAWIGVLGAIRQERLAMGLGGIVP